MSTDVVMLENVKINTQILNKGRYKENGTEIDWFKWWMMSVSFIIYAFIVHRLCTFYINVNHTAKHQTPGRWLVV